MRNSTDLAPRDQHGAPPDTEPTLGAVMRALARRRPPRHLLEGVSVALPWALYFGWMGWWRAAMAATAVGSFGLWALCHRWSRHSVGWRRIAAIAARDGAATVMAVLLAVLALDLFFRLMGAGPIS